MEGYSFPDVLEAAVLRGQNAHDLLNSVIFADTFSVLEQECIADWRNSEFRTPEQREEIFLRMKTTGQILRAIQKLVDDGKIAESQLQKRQKKA